MILTDAQKQTLADHIRANTDADVVAALAIRNDTELARLYNLASTVIVWREEVLPEEYKEALVWTEVDGLQAGKARIWEWLTEQMTAPYNASSANVRQGLADVFPANQSTRGNLLAISKEAASLAQSLFITGTGTDQSPGVRVVQGTLSINNIGDVLNNF